MKRLLSNIAANHINISLNEDDLNLNSDGESIDPDLLKEIQLNKEKLVACRKSILLKKNLC